MTKALADLDQLSPLSGFATELASLFVSLAGDIAVVVGQDGVIQNFAVSDAIPAPGAWVGRPWAETVTGDTRAKIELLLQEAGASGVTRRREVNLPGLGGTEIPISYSALRLGRHGPVIAVGRDLRVVAAIQQQMLDAQQDMERDYWTLRRNQSHQHELNQVAHDAVMVVSGYELQVTLANAAATAMFTTGGGALLPQALEPLHKVLRSGKPVEMRTRLKISGRETRLVDLFVTPFQGQGPAFGTPRMLLRARQVGTTEAVPANTCTVITDTQGRILMASDTLIALGYEPDPNGLYGKSLCQLLDNAQGVLAGLLNQVLRDGMGQLSSAILGGHRATVCVADVQASLINDGDQERIGFCLQLHESNASGALAGTLEQILADSQKQPLAALLQQVQTLAEQHAIGNALRSTGANLSASASALGISSTDLAQRMARLGLDLAHFTSH